MREYRKEKKEKRKWEKASWANMGLPVVGKKYYCLHAITVAREDKEKKLFGTLQRHDCTMLFHFAIMKKCHL